MSRRLEPTRNPELTSDASTRMGSAHPVLFAVYRRLALLKQRLLPGIQVISLPFLSGLNREIRQRILPREVTLRGHTFELDPQDSLKLSTHGSFEDLERNLILRHLATGGVALDIGANLGYHALEMARRVGPTGHVVAFEPAPNIAPILRRNVERNGYRNIRVEEVAASDRTGTARLTLSDTNLGDNRLVGGAGAGVEVSTVRIDEYLATHRLAPTFIKIDVQGAEPAVLRGMASYLRAAPELAILFEYGAGYVEAQGEDPLAPLQLLVDAGFTLIDVLDPDYPNPTNDLSIFVREYQGTRHTNILATKNPSSLID